MISAEQVVLPSKRKRPDGILDQVVVDQEATVVHITAQPWQKREGVLEGFTNAAVFGDLARSLVHPFFELADDRIGFLTAFFFQLITFDFGRLGLILYMVESVDIDQSFAGYSSILLQSIAPFPSVIKSL